MPSPFANAFPAISSSGVTQQERVDVRLSTGCPLVSWKKTGAHQARPNGWRRPLQTNKGGAPRCIRAIAWMDDSGRLNSCGRLASTKDIWPKVLGLDDAGRCPLDRKTELRWNLPALTDPPPDALLRDAQGLTQGLLAAE